MVGIPSNYAWRYRSHSKDFWMIHGLPEDRMESGDIDSYDHEVCHVKAIGIDGKTNLKTEEIETETIYEEIGPTEKVIFKSIEDSTCLIIRYPSRKNVDFERQYYSVLTTEVIIPYLQRKGVCGLKVINCYNGFEPPLTKLINASRRELNRPWYPHHSENDWFTELGIPYNDNGTRKYPCCDGYVTKPAEQYIPFVQDFRFKDLREYCMTSFREAQPDLDAWLYKSYLDCVCELKLNSNTIANTLEIIDLVLSLRHPVKLLENLGNSAKALKGLSGWKDAWLKYRYCYSTTKSDIKEIMKKRDLLLAPADRTITIRASSAEPINTHIRIKAKPHFAFNDGLDALYTVLNQDGLAPDAYNAWDMVPFSFVADWFLPIGDYLEQLQQYEWARVMPFKTTCLVSHKMVKDEGNLTVSLYYRYHYDPGNFTYYEDKSGDSVKTWVKRGLDIISLT